LRDTNDAALIAACALAVDTQCGPVTTRPAAKPDGFCGSPERGTRDYIRINSLSRLELNARFPYRRGISCSAIVQRLWALTY
jgi:hypothetical protein